MGIRTLNEEEGTKHRPSRALKWEPLASLARALKMRAFAVVSGDSVMTCRHDSIAFSMIVLERLEIERGNR